jgi:hypothetical protein
MPSPPPFWFYLILHLFLHPFTVSSGRAQGGPALAAFWARVREATGSSSGAAAAAAFFIAALDAFAARGKACGETCVEGGSPSTSVQSASVALSTCPGPALSTPRATWWKGSFPSGVVSACFHDTVCERAADIKPGGVGMLVAGLCLALGGEPNLRKKKGWLFFQAALGDCMRDPTLACMRDRSSRTQRTGRGRRRGSVAPACSSAVSRSSKL